MFFLCLGVINGLLLCIVWSFVAALVNRYTRKEPSFASRNVEKGGCVFILAENGVALWFLYSVVVKTKCKCRFDTNRSRFDTHVKSF